MAFPSFSPDSSPFRITAAHENTIIKSENAGTSLTSELPNLDAVTNGFTVGFVKNHGVPHTIAIQDGRSENIAVVGFTAPDQYAKTLTLSAENEVVFLTIDEVGNWRITGGTAYSSIPFRAPLLVETGEGVAAGHHVPFLDENAQFSGAYLGWVTQGDSPVLGAPNIEIVVPTGVIQEEVIGVGIQWDGGRVETPTCAVHPGDNPEKIAQRLAAAVVAIPTLVRAGFFTYAIPGSDRLNLQWLTTTTGPVRLTPLNGVSVRVDIRAVSEATDYLACQLGRTYGREARAYDSLKAFDWTGPNGSSPGIATHWGQIAVQIVDPDPSHPAGRMYLTSRVRPGSGEPMGTLYLQNGGMVLYDNQKDPEPAGGGSMGPGTINLPGSGGIYIDGKRVL